jgi:hypothetical protein
VLGTLAAGAAAALIGVAASGPAPRPAHGAVPWPAPKNTLPLVVAAGLKSERHETLIHHVHAHLDVFVNGKPERVPAAIGINIKDPGVHVFMAQDGSKVYGGIRLCRKPCISPLHTHDATGILHTESAAPVANRLGQFFTEWGVRLTRTCVGGYCRAGTIRIFVNGKRYAGDPRAILLTNKKEIAVVIGTPPKKIPARFPGA